MVARFQTLFSIVNFTEARTGKRRVRARDLQHERDRQECRPTVYVPPSTESFDYDSDGNLRRGGHWQYTWDLVLEMIKSGIQICAAGR